MKLQLLILTLIQIIFGHKYWVKKWKKLKNWCNGVKNSNYWNNCNLELIYNVEKQSVGIFNNCKEKRINGGKKFCKYIWCNNKTSQYCWSARYRLIKTIIPTCVCGEWTIPTCSLSPLRTAKLLNLTAMNCTRIIICFIFIFIFFIIFTKCNIIFNKFCC